MLFRKGALREKGIVDGFAVVLGVWMTSSREGKLWRRYSQRYTHRAKT